MRLVSQIKKNPEGIHFQKDIFAGIVVALVSIPISMGYAQIAGLPAVYGLYGSVLPILVYGLLTTSPQFVVGIDAMPAAMVGGILTGLEIAAESEEAMNTVPVVTFLVAFWFIVLRFFRAGRVVKYISTPVMGGFISGVGTTIILMQIPKLFGGNPGTGEIFALAENIAVELVSFNPLSFLLGIGTILIILFCKKRISKVPMTVIMMAVGAGLQYFLRLDRFGVRMMAQVEGGLPGIWLPDPEYLPENILELVIPSLGIAGVIMAQTLLASGNYAQRYHDKLDTNAELVAYAAMNAAGGMVGVCPVNGSVSRSGIADSLGCRSQIMSVTASVTMVLVLLFGTPLFQYLPVPILTGIVITALIGILEIGMVRKLWKVSKNEWLIFMTAYLGVLVFGTVYGVVIGVLLSFWEVAIRASVPPTALVGRILGQEDFYSLERNRAARPIRNTVIYRFSGNLFFANIDMFQAQIEEAVTDDTHQVIVDARGIGSVDITAAERLVLLNKSLRSRGIYFYLTEHDGSLNDQLRRLGGGSLIEEGAVRRTISLALRDAGVEKPYELEGDEDAGAEKPYKMEGDEDDSVRGSVNITGNGDVCGEAVRNAGQEMTRAVEADERLSEFEWAFGKDAEKRMEEFAGQMADEIARAAGEGGNVESVEAQMLDREGVRTPWGMLGRFDEDEFWDFVELRLEELKAKEEVSPEFVKRVEKHVEERRRFGQQKLRELSPRAAGLLARRREVIFNYMRRKHPEEYEKLLKIHEEQKREEL